jgi:hypothetical protein
LVRAPDHPRFGEVRAAEFHALRFLRREVRLRPGCDHGALFLGDRGVNLELEGIDVGAKLREAALLEYGEAVVRIR